MGSFGQDRDAKLVMEIPKESKSGGHFRFYRRIKSSPSAEQYVFAFSNKRRVIAQLRCGCLPLEVELGRYRSPKTPFSERTCQLCQNGVGDEVHFIIACPLLDSQRDELSKAIVSIVSNYTALSPEEKTLQAILSCASVPEMGN